MKKIIPYGNRLLVRRKKISETEAKKSLIVMPDEVKERLTDIAEVVYIPEHSFADKALIKDSESIINSLTNKASNGDAEALKGLIEFNYYLKIKSLQPGMTVFISKYCGTDFSATGEVGVLTLCSAEDVMGVIKDV